jgi:RNA polymerase sigma factor (sigma-70 family)
MATAPTPTVLQHIRQLAGAAPQRSDRQLLDDFASRRDEGAFAALVERHGAMVLRVCRRILGHEQDAEDAFQATFLVLAGGAVRLRRRDTLAGWLHMVARRTALKARRTAARRRAREERPRPPAPPSPPGLLWEEVRTVLDEEVGRLAEPFRSAFVLCALEGKTGPQAAAALGCKEATLYTRMNRARRLLQKALAARGIELAALLGVLAVADGAAPAAPAALIRPAVRFGLLVAAGEPAAAIPSHVAALAAGVTRAMLITKTKIATVLMLAAGLLAVTALWAQQAKNADKPPARAAQPEHPEGVPGKPQTADARKADENFVYRGQVLGPDGKPFAGAKLYLVGFREDAKAPPVRATTGRDGRFEFTAARAEFVPAAAPADLDVFASLPVVAAAKGYAADWTMPGKRPSGDLTLRLAANDTAIDGRALDLQGKPVAGAKVHVLRIETTADDDLAPFLAAWRSAGDGHLALGQLTKVLHDPTLAGLPRTVTTDADGRFRLPAAGNERVVVLSIEAPLIEHAVLRVLPRDPAQVKALVRPVSESMMRRGTPPPPVVYGSRFDHLAAPARAIVGTVRDKESGKPLAGIRIMGNAVGGAGGARPETYTDKQGRYRLQGLPKAEKYHVFAWPGDFSVYIVGGKEVDGGEGTATAEADFEMVRGVEVRGRVTDKVTGKPVAAGVRYVPLAANGHPAAGFFRMCAKGCDGPRPGTFREMVPPGPGVFLVIVRAADGDNPYKEVRLDPADQAKAGLDRFLLLGVNAYHLIDAPADAKSLTCEVQVDPGRSVTGTVLGPDGKPLAGARVKGLTAVWPRPTALKTAAFTALALDPGAPRELLFVDLKRKLAGQLVVRGDEKGDVAVQLAPWGVLTGRVLDEDGRPVGGARIQMGFLHPMFFQPVTWWVSPHGEEVRTDREGRFRAEGLTPGMKFRLTLSSDSMMYLPLADTPDGARELSVRAGESKDLGDLKVKAP